ncbi:hypothetical protein [Deinococcus yunweiensis]|uniref:hypothetical protein n=1 Tax=Deinococcus yunweiensis TaxID=367282 RepID=UPI00398F4AB1
MDDLSPKQEHKIGPITVFYQAEPPLPSILEQARVVADFMLATSLSEEVDASLYRRFRAGEIEVLFRQHSQAEIDAEKERFTIIDERGKEHILFDLDVLSRGLLSPEHQLEYMYRSARAQMWSTEHASAVTWAEWDTYRLEVDINQVETLSDLPDNESTSRVSAFSRAEQLARIAVNTGSKTSLEVSTLSAILLQSMFVGHQIALPLHSNLPIKLPSQIPSWAWEGGLNLLVPYWWTIRERGEWGRKSRGKHAPPSQFAGEDYFRNSTHWILGKNQTALNQRAGWTEQSMAGLSVPRGFVPDNQTKNYEVLFYLGLPEFEDEEQPKPLSARDTVEVLQRFGRLHSYLHLGIRCALSRSNGQALELAENDLLFFSGLEEAVRKGDLKRVDALNQINAALRDLRTLSLFVRSKDKKVQTGRFPLFRIEPLPIMADGELRSLVARVDAGLWARSFYTFDAPSYDVASAVFRIPRNQLIASGFAVWLAANVWRFSKGHKVTLERILREVIPRIKPENAEDWEGHNITWEDLEPDKAVPGYNPDYTKDRRRWVRDQIARLPATLAKHRIKISVHGDKSAGRSWEEFLAQKVSASFTSDAKAIDIPTIALALSEERKITAEDIRAALQRLGMKQGSGNLT